jgi:hypothetical protein
MEVHAKISREWRRRMLFLWAMILGIALWFLWDGYLAWPAEAERYAAYRELFGEEVPAGGDEDSPGPEVQREWREFTAEQGYPDSLPKERTAADLREQRLIGGTLFLLAIFFASWIAWNHTRSLRAEGDTVIAPSGRRVPLDQVVAVDRRKWDSKGIAYALYEEAGRRRKLALDDHKYVGAEAIVLEAERRLEKRRKETNRSEEEAIDGRGTARDKGGDAEG